MLQNFLNCATPLSTIGTVINFLGTVNLTLDLPHFPNATILTINVSRAEELATTLNNRFVSDIDEIVSNMIAGLWTSYVFLLIVLLHCILGAIHVAIIVSREAKKRPKRPKPSPAEIQAEKKKKEDEKKQQKEQEADNKRRAKEEANKRELEQQRKAAAAAVVAPQVANIDDSGSEDSPEDKDKPPPTTTTTTSAAPRAAPIAAPVAAVVDDEEESSALDEDS